MSDKPTTQKAWMEPFVAALEEYGTVSHAARVAGINRQYAYVVRKENPDFAAAWDGALQVATDDLEQEAVRRAKDGSDTLMIFLLKARRPEMYRESKTIEHTGTLNLVELVAKIEDEA